ncbi:MAG: NAD(P)/FAD-dependent oxidoreductase [Planctomycetota bacterium]|nr:NAD(P)/FAD-dependent oxidoreductase [Planctomycetota bacterium]MDA1252433.1 NAD(P)/FAD-dependent oxidoreductase [Planctomycetota bacterium]
MPDFQDSYDVVVIGGGPAGAATGALTAEAGHSTLILERSTVPRFHVGESLVPETYWSLKRLGLVEKLQQSAFPKKYSVQFFSEGMKPSAPFYFDEYKDCESSQTWQVWRDEFDRMLLEKAAENGATVTPKAQVLEVLFDSDRAVGVRFQVTDKAGNRTEHQASCKVVVDASGQSAFLASRLGLKSADPHLKMGTIWSYWKDARRDEGRDEGATLIMQTADKKSWFWFIPLQDNTTSIGCTGAMSYMFPKGCSPEETFERELDRCPAMKERLENATRDRDYLTTKDYSYYATQGAGPGWVMVGDAFGFIDPVYSTGVFLALKSGEFAADAIDAAIKADDLSAERLGEWQATHREGVMLFRKLVYAFYDPDFSFGSFLKANPQYRKNVTDMLIGDVFKPGVGDIFDAMGEVVPS